MSGWETVTSSKKEKAAAKAEAKKAESQRLEQQHQKIGNLARVPCRFFNNGHCEAGDRCRFSHDSRVQPDTEQFKSIPCKFYLEGLCQAGKRCLYSHAKIEIPIAAPAPPPAPAPVPIPVLKPLAPTPVIPPPPRVVELLPLNPFDFGKERTLSGILIGEEQVFTLGGAPLDDGLGDEDDLEFDDSHISFLVPLDSPRRTEPEPFDALEPHPLEQTSLSYASIAMAGSDLQSWESDQLSHLEKLCPFFVSGNCRFGDGCHNTHGLQCPHCLKYCLHPMDAMQAESHLTQCESNVPIREFVRASADYECGICFQKPAQKSRLFGVLSHCDHTYCLDCIREWRGGNLARNIIRSCPLCRVESHLVIPSSYVPPNGLVKNLLFQSYRKRLATIPCKYFEHGAGACPFGIYCFYMHKLTTGERVIVDAPRRMMDADGTLDVVRQVQLSDFLKTAKRGKNKGK